jgi:hypothetical protein
VTFIHLLQAFSSLPTDASALESSISALESEIKTLENSSVPWEHLLPLFTAAVALGVAMELWVIWHERRGDMEAWALAYFLGTHRLPSRPSMAKFIIELVSVLLITLGIVGELGVGIKVTSINGTLRGKSAELRSKSDQLLALVTQQAGDAATSAKVAHNEAGDAATAAGKAQQKAGSVAKQADELNRELLATKTQLSTVDAKRAELEKSLINLAVCNAPRVISGLFFMSGKVETESYVDRLRPMAGQLVFIEFIPDAEAHRAAVSIANTLTDAHWKLQEPPKSVDGLADGVSVQPSVPTFTGGKFPDDMSPYRRGTEAAEKLVDFLHSYNWQAASRSPTDAQGKLFRDEKVFPAGAIRIQVGLYPPAVYVSPPAQKEFASHLEEMKQEEEKAQAEIQRKQEEQMATLPPELRQKLQQSAAEWDAKVKSLTSTGPCQVLNPLY